MVHAAIVAEQEVRENYNAITTPMTMKQIEKLSTSRAKRIIIENDNNERKKNDKDDEDDEHHNNHTIDDETKLQIYSQAFEHAITEAHVTAGTLVSSSSSSQSQQQQQQQQQSHQPLHEITFFPDPSMLISPKQSHDEEDVERQEDELLQTAAAAAAATRAIIDNNDNENEDESTPLLSSKAPSKDYGNNDGCHNNNVLGTPITNNTGGKLQNRRPSSSSSRRVLLPWFQSCCRPVFIMLVVLASIVVYTGISNNNDKTTMTPTTTTTSDHGRHRFMWWGNFRGNDDEGSDKNDKKTINFDKNLIEDDQEDDVHVSDSISNRSKVYSEKLNSIKDASGVNTSTDISTSHVSSAVAGSSSLPDDKEKSRNDENNKFRTTGTVISSDHPIDMKNSVPASHDVKHTPINAIIDNGMTSESSSSEIATVHPTILTTNTVSPSKQPTSVPTEHSPSNTPSTYSLITTLPTIYNRDQSIKPIVSSNTSPSLPSFPTSAPSLAKKYHDVAASTSKTASPTQLATVWETFATEVPTIKATILTDAPTSTMTNLPTMSPTVGPTNSPTSGPTISPTAVPTNSPTISPTTDPTNGPTYNPTGLPTSSPTGVPTFGPSVAPTILPTHEPTMHPTMTVTIQPTVPAIALLPPLPSGADYYVASLLVDDQAFYFPREPVLPKSGYKNPGKGSRMLRGRKLSQATAKKIQHQSAIDSAPPTLNLGWTYGGKTSSLEINAVGQYYLSKGKALQNVSSKPTGMKKHSKNPPFTWSEDWRLDTKGATLLGKAYEFIGTAVEDHYQEYVQGIEDSQSPKQVKKTTNKKSTKHKMTWQADWERGLIIAR